MLLDGRSKEQKIKEAIELLRDSGYIVRGPIIDKTDVKTPSQLVRFFYERLHLFRPGREFMVGGSPTRDLGIAKQLIISRESLGVSKKRAIWESCEIIELLFTYEDKLRLSYPVASMSVLGQDRMGWITERLLVIKEGLDKEVSAQENLEYFDKLYREQENNVDPEDLEEARRKMDGVLKRNAEESKKRES